MESRDPSSPRVPSTSGLVRRPGRVLVIDDEPLLGTAIQRAFAGQHAVQVVQHAADALARLRAGERYDVVLCDVRMPRMDGIDFHERLRADLPAEADRIVFITGGALDDRAEDFFRVRPNTLLEKPVDLYGLRALVERRIRGDEGDGEVAKKAPSEGA